MENATSTVVDDKRDRTASGGSTVSVTSATTVETAAGAGVTTAILSPEAEALKETGNKLFSDGKYAAAIDAWTQAIEMCPTAALYANRAFAQLKSENYGLAVADANAAIALDPAFIKAYYRRGSAHLALQKHKEARADFRIVVKLKPGDKDASAKLAECEKAIKIKQFEMAIAMEAPKPITERVNPDIIAVDSSYTGQHLPAIPEPGTAATIEECMADETKVNQFGISLGFVKGLMADFKAQKSLHRKYAQQLLLRLYTYLRTLPSLVHASVPTDATSDAVDADAVDSSSSSSSKRPARFNICGDTHGQYYDTLNIFELAGLPSPTNAYLFNGDFVDRGSFSVENVLTLFAWKLLLPDHMHLTRGNHETKNMNKMYGFEGEVKAKFDLVTMEVFSEVFCALPLAVVVNKKVFVVHGGLFQKDGVTLNDIANINRFSEPPESGLMSDILWSDPQVFPGRGPSKRGVGQSFGPDITARFLEDNGLSLVVRSHEVMEDGYQVFHNGKLITVFSAPNYCDQMGNKGAIVHLDAACNTTFTQFAAVPHPPVRPMAFAGGMSSMFGF